ncbi:MAG: hypothetical protein WCK67_04450 [bacterium]
MLNESFNSENFRKNGHAIVDKLANYMKNLEDNQINEVLPPITPKQMLLNWDNNFQTKDFSLDKFTDEIITQSNHLHHPKYIGHQVSAPLPLASLFDMMSSLLNNGAAIYEMGPVSTIMEKEL